MSVSDRRLLGALLSGVVVAFLVNLLPAFQERGWLIPSVASVLVLAVIAYYLYEDATLSRLGWGIIGLGIVLWVLWIPYRKGQHDALAQVVITPSLSSFAEVPPTAPEAVASATIPLPTATLAPTPPPITELSINKVVATTVCLAEGEAVNIQAEGRLYLGQFVQWTDNAEGKDSIGPIPIDKKYYKYREYPLGMLMCKLDTEESWRGCGTEETLRAPVAGCLEFDVNDVILTDNDGSYTVTIERLD